MTVSQPSRGCVPELLANQSRPHPTPSPRLPFTPSFMDIVRTSGKHCTLFDIAHPEMWLLCMWVLGCRSWNDISCIHTPTPNIIVPEDPFYSLCKLQSHSQRTGRNVWLQEHAEVVKQPLFVWVGLCVWMIFGRLCVLCPSCLCCHGDSFILKPVFVFVFISGLLRYDNRFLQNRFVMESHRGTWRTLRIKILKQEAINHVGLEGEAFVRTSCIF